MKRGLLLLFFTFIVFFVQAQPGMGDPPVEGVPITSGIIYLILVALGFGVNSLKSKNKK